MPARIRGGGARGRGEVGACAAERGKGERGRLGAEGVQTGGGEMLGMEPGSRRRRRRRRQWRRRRARDRGRFCRGGVGGAVGVKEMKHHFPLALVSRATSLAACIACAGAGGRRGTNVDGVRTVSLA